MFLSTATIIIEFLDIVTNNLTELDHTKKQVFHGRL